ncbi:MAG: AcrR family transcriptional regulator [Crocinitomix sp.]|jgi:AcrR family transcriptional regulator
MKKNTGEKILDTALKLFNLKGLAPITLRTIAKEMGISQGNLNYHYKKRDDIIEALYFRLVSDMDASMAKIEQSKIGVQLVYDTSSAIMNNSYKYRFFMADFTQVMRQNKKIKNHFISLLKIREEQAQGLFDVMIHDGLMRSERLENEYYNLYKRIQILGDFWIGSAEIERSRIVKKTIVEYLEIIMQSIYPYLTEKGVNQYSSLKR